MFAFKLPKFRECLSACHRVAYVATGGTELRHFSKHLGRLNLWHLALYQALPRSFTHTIDLNNTMHGVNLNTTTPTDLQMHNTNCSIQMPSRLSVEYGEDIIICGVFQFSTVGK